MSRPRQPFGAQHPGRLPATMVKVLAAEMSDPSRLRRGKQYAKDGSVLDIVIEPGVVTCEIQGSRPTPYIASIEVTPGDGMPLRRDITCTCTCPDDDNWENHACKHVVAALFTLSNELLLEPELLDVWRDVGGSREQPAGTASSGPASTSGGDRRSSPSRHLRAVPDPAREDDDAGDVERATQTVVDPFVDVMGLPAGTSLPDIPLLDDADLAMPKDRVVAAALRDALAHVRVDWD